MRIRTLRFISTFVDHWHTRIPRSNFFLQVNNIKEKYKRIAFIFWRIILNHLILNNICNHFLIASQFMSRNKYLSKTNYCCQTLSRNSFVFTLDKLIFTRKYQRQRNIYLYRKTIRSDRWIKTKEKRIERRDKRDSSRHSILILKK